jgi:hypothetical protein
MSKVFWCSIIAFSLCAAGYATPPVGVQKEALKATPPGVVTTRGIDLHPPEGLSCATECSSEPPKRPRPTPKTAMS